jgi:pimeloyl-ACP methyl ester carboxylesterase
MSQPAPKLYLLSGLGADEQAFQTLDLTGFDPHFIQWLPPQAGEDLAHYAGRLRGQISEANPTLIGLSFGGMVAVEIAKQVPVERVILLASAKTKYEIPIYYRWASKLQLPKLLPTRLLKSANWFSYWLFGAQKPADRQLLRHILADTDDQFLRWALVQAANWANTAEVPGTWHIHGTADRVLPFWWVRSDWPIPGGGHLLPLDKPEEVGQAIRAALLARP